MSSSSASTAFSIIPLFNIILDHVEDAIPDVDVAEGEEEQDREGEAEVEGMYNRVVSLCLYLRI